MVAAAARRVGAPAGVLLLQVAAGDDARPVELDAGRLTWRCRPE